MAEHARKYLASQIGGGAEPNMHNGKQALLLCIEKTVNSRKTKKIRYRNNPGQHSSLWIPNEAGRFLKMKANKFLHESDGDICATG